MIIKHITSMSAVGLVSALCLNLTIQTAGRFVFGVIVPIPPHMPNIMGNQERELDDSVILLRTGK